MMSLVVALGLLGPSQPPGRGQPLPIPQPVPLPAPVPAAVTLADFSRVFTPLPGKHQVWFVHPATGRPVEVCFTLPPGRLKRFEVDDRWIEFKFDKCEVRIDFRRNGGVEVDHDH